MTRSQCTLLSLVLASAYAGCGVTSPADDVTLIQGAVTGNLVISGRVTNSSGNGLANVTVTLAGSASTSQQTTTTGAYSFGALTSGSSYSVRPTMTNCAFSPDVANLNNLTNNATRNFVGSGSGCAAGAPATPITRKFMSLIYNPIIESRGGARLITLQGWNNPDTLTTQFVADVATASNNLVTYVAGPRVELDAYPVSEDGFQYTDATFMACLDASAKIPFDKTKCHKPDQADGFGYAIDYLAMLNSNNVCARFNAGEFDELWMFGAPFMGFWEANQAGSQAVNTNGPIVVGSACQGRLNIFGFAYHVGETNMLHDYGHRIDGVMVSLLPNGGIAEFTRNDFQNPGQAQCGITHFTPTSAFEYDYGNTRNVTSSCADWLNYPNRTGATTTINCSAWGCDERLYHIWRMQHLPHVAGVAADGSSNNWWTYILSR
jgi:hypothetical protein